MAEGVFIPEPMPEPNSVLALRLGLRLQDLINALPTDLKGDFADVVEMATEVFRRLPGDAPLANFGPITTTTRSDLRDRS